MKFLHSMIRVKDIDASLKFYTELLNMKLDHKKRLEDCELYFLNDESGCCQIELTYNDETPKDGYKIGEISCPTKYFPEASSINFSRSCKYGLEVLSVSLKYRLAKMGVKILLFNNGGKVLDSEKEIVYYYKNK